MAEKNYKTVAVVPEMPRTIDNQQLHIYTPVGSTDNFGVFKPDGQQFVIVDGVLRADVTKLIQLANQPAIVTENGGNVGVDIAFTEPDNTLNRKFQFTFKNIKGETGATGATGAKGDTGDNALIYSGSYTETYVGDVMDEPIHLDIANFSRTPVKGDTFILVYYTTETEQTTISLFSIYNVYDTYAEAQAVSGTQYVITGPKGEQGIQGEPGTPGKDGVSITSVTQTGVQGGTQVTITLSNGQSTSFIVYNGINTNFQVVNALPTENISTSTIYLVPATTPGEENVYDEYIYVNGNWEHIGSTTVDLSDYVTKTFFNQNVGDTTKNYVDAQVAQVAQNVQDNLEAHINDTDNPHHVTKVQLGLGNVNNTSDKNKPISISQQAALDNKLDKVKTTTDNPQVYAKNADGKQGMLNVGGTADDDIATVGQVNATEPYHITLEKPYGSVTEEQYNKLKADKRSYVYLTNDGITVIKTASTSTYLQFGASAGLRQWKLQINQNFSYTFGSWAVENELNKKKIISGAGDDTYYPTTKAVVDYVKANAPTANFITLRTTSGTLSDADFTKLDSDDNSYILLTYSGQQYKLLKNVTSTTDLIYSVVDNEQEYKITILLSDHTWGLQVITLENTANRVTEIKASSADEEYPSAAATYAYGQTVLTNAKAYTDTAIANAITTALNTPV